MLPAADTLDRVLARRRMEAALLDGLPAERLQDLDQLLLVDPAIRITRFAWLRSSPGWRSGSRKSECSHTMSAPTRPRG